MYKYAFFLGVNSLLCASECFISLTREGYSPEIIIQNKLFLIISLKKKLVGNFIDRLGGTLKIALVIEEKNEAFNCQDLLKALSPAPGKINVGFGFLNVSRKQIHGLAKDFKKACGERDCGIRYIMPRGENTGLNAAQVIFNKLTGPSNREFTFIKKGNKNYLVVTEQVQNISAYEKRDTKRPTRSMKVGLMPPKLAQVCINLVPSLSVNKSTIYDPFCGMGTVLQEGWLMGYKMIGSDKSEEMVKASQENLKWVIDNLKITNEEVAPFVFKHDISKEGPIETVSGVDAIVTEPYLGEPLNKYISREEACEQVKFLGQLYLNFFKNVKGLLANQKGWVVFILPAFFLNKGNYLLFPNTFIDQIENIGYNYQSLIPKEMRIRRGLSRRGTFLYARPNALVGREITIWKLN